MNGRRTSRASELSSAQSPIVKTPRRLSTSSNHAAPLTPLQEGSERVKVVVRVRPPGESESASGLRIIDQDTTIVLPRKHENAVQTEFQFDQVLGTEADQQDVYQAAVAPIVKDVLQGYNGTIMAYGQTGAGKTFTLSSITSAENIGMMPRAAAHIFSEINADSSHIYNVVMAYAQIYREQILDLLKPDNKNLAIREGKNGVFLSGIEEQPVMSVADCLRHMQHGDLNRKTALTQMNAHSSRSHAIVMLTVVKRARKTSSSTSISEDEEIKVGKLFIVDLAGSERLKKSLSTGVRADEAKAINLSLTTLGLCINARADRSSKHVPFRDSKLTRLLQESLGGNAKTSLVIAVADAAEHLEESLQSIQFGQRAMRVQTKAKINESIGSDLLNADLLKRLSSMDIATCVVDANLLAKEEELRAIQSALAGEKERALKAIADLEAARVNDMEEAQAKLSQQELQAQKHEADLSGLRGKLAESDHRRREEVQRLESGLRAVQSDFRIHKATSAEEIQRLKKSLASVEAELATESELASTSAKQRADSEAQASSLATQLREATSQLQGAHSDASRLRQESKARESSLTQQISQLTGERDSAQREIRDKDSSMQALTINLASAKQLHLREKEDASQQITRLQELLQQRDLQTGDAIAKLHAESAQAVNKLQKELEEVKKELFESDQQVTLAHQQAAEAHQHAADTTQESLRKIDALKHDQQLNLKEMRTKHDAVVSQLLEEKAAETDRLQQSLRAARRSNEDAQTALQNDLQELQTSSSKRIRDLQKSLETQREDFTSRLESSEQGWTEKVEALEARQAKDLYDLSTAAAEKLQAVEDKYQAELQAQEIKLNQDSKGISELKAKLQQLQKSYEELDHVHTARKHELEEVKKESEMKLAARDIKLEVLARDKQTLEGLLDLIFRKQRKVEAATLIQRYYRRFKYCILNAERNKDAQDLALTRMHKHSLEGQKASLEAAALEQKMMAGINMFRETLTMLDESLLSVKFAFLADQKSRTSFVQMQGRSNSMSPLASLGSKGIHYNPSPLGRMESFASDASEKSSNHGGANGPLGSGFSIPAYQPRGNMSTPRRAYQQGRDTPTKG